MVPSAVVNVKIIIFAASCAIASFFLVPACAQSVKVVHNKKVHFQQVARDSNQAMVELKSLITDLQYDIRYATTQNFTGRQLYQKGNKTFLRRPAALALQSVQTTLASRGLALKVWDAYRPYAATQLMWNLIGDERYVANPAKGSGHNRGLAVDVTLIDLQTGNELEMGTAYDHFSDTAHHTFTALPQQVLQNRRLLKEVMESAGFKALSTEWWHYAWPNDRGYDVMDFSFDQLALFSKKYKKKF